MLKIKEKKKKKKHAMSPIERHEIRVYFHLRLFADARIHFRAAFVPRESIARVHTRMLADVAM